VFWASPEGAVREKEFFMSTILEPAKLFFDACETGKGWEGCKDYCRADATFSAQTGALAELHTLESYCGWMRDLITPVPDANYELKFFAADESRSTVTAVAVFRGTHTGPGGPVPATGNSFAADYAYYMEFDGGRIKHMTKIWNDTISLQQLGWA
jgi:ketosteroid isomerase-like protein